MDYKNPEGVTLQNNENNRRKGIPLELRIN
jgi:hypothetical protein